MVSSKVRLTGGGVGRNIVEALSKLKLKPRFLSAVGDDVSGKLLLQFTEKFVDCRDMLVCDGVDTATCVVVLEHKTSENVLLIGNMDIHRQISLEYLSSKMDVINGSSILLLDGNISVDTMQMVMELCLEKNIPLWFEPTDVVTAAKPFNSQLWKRTLQFISPNLQELRQISSAVTGESVDSYSYSDEADFDQVLEEAIRLAVPLAHNINTIMVTLGQHGVLVVGQINDNLEIAECLSRGSNTMKKRTEGGLKISARYYKCDSMENIVSVSGAGDCTVAGFMRGVLEELTEPECMSIALSAAADSLSCINTVPDRFTSASSVSAQCKPKIINICNHNT